LYWVALLATQAVLIKIISQIAQY
jgi:hypothetical protein